MLVSAARQSATLAARAATRRRTPTWAVRASLSTSSRVYAAREEPPTLPVPPHSSARGEHKADIITSNAPGASAEAAKEPEMAPRTAPATPAPPPPPSPEVASAGDDTGASVRPVGGLRGGLIGFLVGVLLTGTLGYLKLLEDYESATRSLGKRIEGLKTSVADLEDYAERLAKMEKSLKTVETDAARRKEVAELRREFKHLSEAEHLDLLDLKAHVWGLEQEIVLQKKQNDGRIAVRLV